MVLNKKRLHFLISILHLLCTIHSLSYDWSQLVFYEHIYINKVEIYFFYPPDVILVESTTMESVNYSLLSILCIKIWSIFCRLIELVLSLHWVLVVFSGPPPNPKKISKKEPKIIPHFSIIWLTYFHLQIWTIFEKFSELYYLSLGQKQSCNLSNGNHEHGNAHFL